MANNLTVGDDFIAPCPHCGKKMNIGYISASNQLKAGFIDFCPFCSKEFRVEKIDYIPNVWLGKNDPDVSLLTVCQDDSRIEEEIL